MNSPHRRLRWARAALTLLAVTAVGVIAYNFGVSHGLAEHVSAGAPAAYAYPYPYPYPYPRPWGFGFLSPLLFLFLGFFVLRLLLWGGGRGRWQRSGACASGRGHHVPPMFDEWHRRAHARDTEDDPSPATSV